MRTGEAINRYSMPIGDNDRHISSRFNMSDTTKPGKSEPTFFKRVDNFMRGFAHGVSFGSADTIAAIGNTVAEGGGKAHESVAQAFKRNLAEEAARTAQAQSEGPEEAAGRLAGSLVFGLGFVRLFGGFTKASRYADLKETREYLDKQPPMTIAARENILEAVDAGFSRRLNNGGAIVTGISGVMNTVGQSPWVRGPLSSGVDMATNVAKMAVTEALALKARRDRYYAQLDGKVSPPAEPPAPKSP